MKEQKSVEEILKEYKLKLLEKYKNTTYNHEMMDYEGYKYSISFENLKKRKNKNMASGRYNDKNRFKEYNIYHYMEINIKNGTDIIKIPQNIETEEAEFICGVCKKKFYQLWKVFMRNNPFSCCQRCVYKLKKTKKKSHEYISDIYKKYKYIPLEECNKGMHYAYYVQDKFGYKGRLVPYNASKKKYGVEKFNSSNKYSYENIDLFFKRNHIPLRVSNNNDNIYHDNKKIFFICECGSEFATTLNNVIGGKVRCNACSSYISNNEYIILNWLKSNKIDYVNQYKITNYSNYQKLFFDFFLSKFNVLIEVDGEQHERPVKFGGCSDEEAYDNFMKQLDRDLAKEKYCQENNIPLYHITYKDIKNKNYINILNSIIHGD